MRLQELLDFVLELLTPTLGDEARDTLDAQISDSEIAEAMSHLKRGKAPGPNEFPPNVFKCLSTQIVLHLEEMFRSG